MTMGTVTGALQAPAPQGSLNRTGHNARWKLAVWMLNCLDARFVWLATMAGSCERWSPTPGDWRHASAVTF